VRRQLYTRGRLSKRESGPLPASCLCSKKCLQFRLQLIKLPIKHRPFRIDNNIKTRRELSSCLTENFANLSSDSIPIVRFPQFPRRRQAEAAVVQRIRQQKDNKGARNPFHALFVNFRKLSGLSQTKVFWKCVRLRDGTPCNGGQD